MEVHSTMFIPTLESQTTPEQKEKWLPKAASYEIVGTFAQTELGHGKYLIFERFMEVCWPLPGRRTTFEFLVLAFAQGWIYSQQGPVQKKCGALQLGRQTLFFLKKNWYLF